MRKSKSAYPLKPLTLPSISNNIFLSPRGHHPLFILKYYIPHSSIQLLTLKTSASAPLPMHSTYSAKDCSYYGATSKNSNPNSSLPTSPTKIKNPLPLQLRNPRACRSNAALRNMASGRSATRRRQTSPALMKKAMRVRSSLTKKRTLGGSADGGFGARRLYEVLVYSNQ